MKVDSDLIQGTFYEWKLQKVMETTCLLQKKF